MNRTILLSISRTLFVLSFCVFVIWHRTHVARVLVIHSYDQDYTWVTEENEGVNRFFSKHPTISIKWHYMDLKRHKDPDFRRQATSLAITAIQRWKPDVVIVFDDIAQELVATQYENSTDLSIVFAGVNNEPAAYGYDSASNVTGVLERKPLKAVDDALGLLWSSNYRQQRKPRVLLIGDKSFDFDAGLFEYAPDRYTWRNLQWLPPAKVDTFDDWKSLVLRSANSVDFLLVSDYRQIHRSEGSAEFVPARELIGWTEANAKIPVVGLTTAATQDGAMMGIATAGYEQGLLAAQMAYEIVNGRRASSIPVVAGHQSMVSIRKSAFDHRGLEVPAIYEAFARAIDHHYD